MREGCHLCEPARLIVEDVCAQMGVQWTEVNIDTAPELREKYGDEVPVVTVDGKTVGFWRIDPGVLRGALS